MIENVELKNLILDKYCDNLCDYTSTHMVVSCAVAASYWANTIHLQII